MARPGDTPMRGHRPESATGNARDKDGSAAASLARPIRPACNPFANEIRRTSATRA